MKAVVYTQYGSPDVLRLREVDKPSPSADEVLLKVRAASVNAGDWRLLRADPFPIRLMAGLFRPKFTILGADVAGVVEAVGSKFTQFRPGDEVYGDLSLCGFGAFAEYATAGERFLAPKPKNLSFEEAAAVPAAAVTALQALRDKGGIQAGQRVLVHGASGGVGMYSVQIAKASGAEVTGACSTSKLDLVASLGANHVIDYTKEDFAGSGRQYDLIHAANGDRSIFAYRRALTANGTYVMSGGSMRQFYQAALLGPLLSMGSAKKLGNMLVRPNQADLMFVSDWIESGKIAPVIDRIVPLNEVPDAIRHIEGGHARGKVVVRIQ